MPGKISYFKNGISQVVPTLDITVLDALNDIRRGKHRDQVEQLRATTNKSSRHTLKRYLPYVTFSGTFKKRNATSLVKHSGIIVIDLDDLDLIDADPLNTHRYNDVTKLKYLLTFDPYILAMFVSPSGNGLKLLMQIDGNVHLEAFEGISQYFAQTYGVQVDASGKDVCRATYLSYDADVYINADAKPFTAIAEPNLAIDYETGEVITKAADTSSMDEKSRQSYERAVYVVQQIEEVGMDLTDNYENWLMIGMSLAVYGEAGRDLYHRVSQYHPDYKPGSCDRKFDDLLKKSRFTSPAKFFALAKERGLKSRKTTTAPEGTPEGVKPEFVTFNAPNGCTMTDQMKEETLRYGFMEHNNQYWVAKWVDDNSKVNYHAISNYVVRPLFLIVSNSEPKRLFEMRNMYGHANIVDMPAANMVSVQNFCSLIESKGNYLIEMSKSQFHKLKTKWYDATKNAEEIKTLGWHRDGFYAFSNGIYYDRKFRGIDEYGVIEKVFRNEEGEEYKRYYFIPANSDIYKDEENEYENEKKFIYINRPYKFTEWAELFVRTHGDNGRVALMYYCASLFRDVLYDRFKFFPHLFGFGPPGTGKSTLGWSLSYMFGKERKPFNLNSGTAPGFYRTFAQFRNAIQWFDEYANSIDLKRIQDLKNAYDGAGHVKGDFSAGGNSNKTVSTPIHSACYISGQELPTADNALFKRCILLQFYKTEYTDQERETARLMREMEELAMSHITAGITSLREVVVENYHNTFDATVKEYKQHLNASYGIIEERIIQNMCIIVAMYRTLAPALNFPFSYDEVKKMTIRMIYEQNKLISKSAETSQFWDTVQYLYNSHQIKDGDDFCIRTATSLKVRIDRNESKLIEYDKPKDMLFLSLNRAHVLYMKVLREQGEKKGMNKESLIHYLQHSKGYLGAVNKVNYGDRITSAYAFDYTLLEEGGLDLRKQVIMPGGGDDDVTTNDW